MSEPPPGTPASGPPAEGGGAGLSSLWRQAQALLRELPALVSDRVELLSLELSRAGRALAQIVALVVAVAVLGVTAWLVLWVAVAAAMVAAGLPGWAAALAVFAVNVVAIAVAVLRVLKLVPLLKLPATRRHLTITPSPEPRSDELNERDRDPAAPLAGAAGAR